MSRQTTIPSDRLSISASALTQLVPFRLRHLPSGVVITNDFGDHLLLSRRELQTVLAGNMPPEDPLHTRLNDANFLRDSFDKTALIARQQGKQAFLRYGPNLHIMVVTLRCDHSCQYCHASRAPMDAHGTDMSIETAERSVDMAFQTTSPGLTIEFQGGEPLANWPVVEHIIEYALQKNALARKALSFALVTNLTLMDDEKLAYLVERRVQLCTSLDGPEDLHNAVRILRHGNSHQNAVRWMRRINELYVAQGLDPNQYRVEALPTITKLSLPRAKEILDHYVEVGCRSIFLRHLDPFGFAAKTQRRLGYDMAEFLAFYDEALDYVIELNRNGIDLIERTAAVFLARILGHHEPNFLDIRNPCGAGIGQLAYNHDGRIFTCDEGRMVDRGGDSCFALGTVHKASYQELMAHPTVRSMVIASTLQGQPGCDTCAYLPWCGICPVHNYVEQGSVQGRMGDSTWCQKHIGILDLLMARLERADPFEMSVFRRWTQVREQAHFVTRAEV